jgi:hypothetical protein
MNNIKIEIKKYPRGLGFDYGDCVTAAPQASLIASSQPNTTGKRTEHEFS